MGSVWGEATGDRGDSPHNEWMSLSVVFTEWSATKR